MRVALLLARDSPVLLGNAREREFGLWVYRALI